MARPGYIGRFLAALLFLGATAHAAPKPDACAAFAARYAASTFVGEQLAGDIKRYANSKQPAPFSIFEPAEISVFDMSLVYAVAGVLRFNDGTADIARCKAVVAQRAAGLGLEPVEYLRRVLVFMPRSEAENPPKLDPVVKDMTMGAMGIILHYSRHPELADGMARDIWRGLSGESVDLSGRLGVDDCDVELELAVLPYTGLYLKAYVNGSSILYRLSPVFAAVSDRLCEWQDGRYSISGVMILRSSAGRDDYARWLYLCWEKYLEKPDEALLKRRRFTLRTIAYGSMQESPTLLWESTRLRLGVAPDRWRAFTRFVEETRTRVWDERLGIQRR
jgi:hypothetical protein